MLDFYRDHKKRVLAAINGIYDALDKSMESGYIADVAERKEISKEEAMELAFENDAYEIITEDFTDEVIELIQALYWAREYGEDMAFPMKDRDTPNPAQSEFYHELGKAITSAPEKARQAKKERDQKEIDRITKEFGEWSDNLNKQMERDFPFLKQD